MRCETCRFFEDGLCKRFPPTVTKGISSMGPGRMYGYSTVRTYTSTTSPRVERDDWCGEYSPRADTEDDAALREARDAGGAAHHEKGEAGGGVMEHATGCVAPIRPRGDGHGVSEIKLIVAANELCGEGVIGDPIRRLVQLWTHDGVLVAEWDAFAGNGRCPTCGAGDPQPAREGEKP